MHSASPESNLNDGPTAQNITSADLLLAAELRSDNSLSATLPAPHEISSLAEELNRAPLPPLPATCYNGIVLPAPEFQLTARTFDVVSSKWVGQRMKIGGNVPSANTVTRILASASSGNTAVTSGGSGGTDGITVVKNKGKGKGGSDQGGRKSGGGSSYGAVRGRKIQVNLLEKRGSVSAPAPSERTDASQQHGRTDASSSDPTINNSGNS